MPKFKVLNEAPFFYKGEKRQFNTTNVLFRDKERRKDEFVFGIDFRSKYPEASFVNSFGKVMDFK